MATKTFAGRTEEENLAFMNALTRKQFNMSYGQYCSSVLIAAVKDGAELPSPGSNAVADRRKTAIEKMKGLSRRGGDRRIASMDDAKIKDLIASRYES